MKFIDTANIYVKAGDGGRGCSSFRGKKFSRYRRRDGGDGGDGGDVIITAEKNIHTLLDFKYRRRFRASDGKPGSGNNKKGKSGQVCVIKVPLGTLVKDEKEDLVLRDLTQDEGKFIVARGGRGGVGNAKINLATEGKLGEEHRLSLELKLIADVGIIGYPNAGKSTLLKRLSQAKPKIASYPFTTLFPVLGAVVDSEYGDFVFAEIPGIIQDAHRGKGLGLKFLRHAERSKIFLHLIDMAAQEGRAPLQDYLNLNQELKSYSPAIVHKSQFIVANKMDLPGAGANLKKFKAKISEVVYPISALKGSGLDKIIEAVAEGLRIYDAKNLS